MGRWYECRRCKRPLKPTDTGNHSPRFSERQTKNCLCWPCTQQIRERAKLFGQKVGGGESMLIEVYSRRDGIGPLDVDPRMQGVLRTRVRVFQRKRQRMVLVDARL